MPRMTTAGAAAAILRREGVTNVFGLPGAAINRSRPRCAVTAESRIPWPGTPRAPRTTPAWA
jgi:glyoxylate carboligase